MDTPPIVSLGSTFSLNTTQAMTRVKTFAQVSAAMRLLTRSLELVDRIQHLVPTAGGGDDGVGIGGPDERFGALVVLGEVAVDGGLEVDQVVEDAALAGAVSLAKNPSTAFSHERPGRRCGRSVAQLFGRRSGGAAPARPAPCRRGTLLFRPYRLARADAGPGVGLEFGTALRYVRAHGLLVELDGMLP